MRTLITLAVRCTAISPSNDQVGCNWTHGATKPDRFIPRRHEGLATALAEPNSEIRSLFGDRVNRTLLGSGNLILLLRSTYTNLVKYEHMMGNMCKAATELPFEEGSPRAVQINHFNSDTIWLFQRKDHAYVMSRLRQSGQLYVRWQQYGDGHVTASIDLLGSRWYPGNPAAAVYTSRTEKLERRRSRLLAELVKCGIRSA